MPPRPDGRVDEHDRKETEEALAESIASSKLTVTSMISSCHRVAWRTGGLVYDSPTDRRTAGPSANDACQEILRACDSRAFSPTTEADVVVTTRDARTHQPET